MTEKRLQIDCSNHIFLIHSHHLKWEHSRVGQKEKIIPEQGKKKKKIEI